jgi:hypothetical protein
MFFKNKVRPYWHVDLKWIFSLLAVITLTVGLFTFGLHRVSSHDRAVTILKSAFGAFAGSSAPEDITIGQVAEDFYQQGPSIVTTLTNDPETQNVLYSQLGMFGILTADVHGGLQMPLIIWSVLAVIFLALAILFSHGFGRLVTAALLMWVVAIPGYALFVLVREAAASYQEAASTGDPITSVSGDIVGHVVAAFHPAYLILFWLGALCLLAAIVGKILWRVLRLKKAQS